MTELVPSREAQAIKKELDRRKQLPSAAAVYRAALPPARWWKAISEGGRKGDPYFETVREISLAHLEDPNLPAWPAGLYEVDEALPPVGREEALAILDRFLRLEDAGIQAGVQIFPMHWEVLAAQYFALREHYSVLKQLVSGGLLTEPTGGPLHRDSGLRWPLTITQAAVDAIRNARFDARLPVLRRMETFLSDVQRSYPTLTKVLLWMTIGGGLLKGIEKLIGWIRHTTP